MRYGFYPGCSYQSSDGYRQSVKAVNEVLGIELVELEGWNCCGATSFFSFDKKNALLLAGRIFAMANSQGFKEIVTVCNACYAALRKAEHEFQSHPDQLDMVTRLLEQEGLNLQERAPIRHYLEILCNDLPVETWSKNGRKDISKIKVASYYGCQLVRPWKDVDDPERPVMLDLFLKRLGFSVVDHSAKTLCCGASHIFPYTKACGSLISRIVQEVLQQGGEMICTICPMCQFNLDSTQKKLVSSPLPVPYFSQLVGIRLGIEPEHLGLDKLFIPVKI